MKYNFLNWSFLLVLSLFCFASSATASNEFITLVNPVRIAPYTSNPGQSIRTQAALVDKYSLPATWLLTFDILSQPQLVQIFQELDQRHELGLFLEITPEFSQASNVNYRPTGSWHHASSVFLSAYSQPDRLKYLDTLFVKFKDTFGYYPTSVGAWWVDSYSLNYLRDKYGVTAHLTCADQFSTDGYQIWGQYWSTPYYPSKNHTGIPGTADNLLDVVVTQWAAREPVNGYLNSTYSTQDYFTYPQQDINYFNKLLNIFARQHTNQFGHITLGLESDLDPSAYKGEFESQLTSVSRLRQEGVSVLTMSEFASWYRSKFPNISPSQLIISPELLQSQTKGYWYQSPYYRIGYLEDPNSQITIRDLRIYNSTSEPGYESPLNENILHINIPSIIDTISLPEQNWTLSSGSSLNPEPDEIHINSSNLTVPHFVRQSPNIQVSLSPNQTSLKFHPTNSTPYVFKSLSLESQHLIRSPKELLKRLQAGTLKLSLETYQVPQGELEALQKLKSLPFGRVMYISQECLQCSWHTTYKPPIFANQRQYVSRLSRKPTIPSSTLLSAPDRSTARQIIKKSQARYLYLTKFEDYFENLVYSPGDYGLELIYENANAQVWRVI